jgi:hypothetical protein
MSVILFRLKSKKLDAINFYLLMEKVTIFGI